jgi:hypothetical protein
MQQVLDHINTYVPDIVDEIEKVNCLIKIIPIYDLS